MFDTNLVTLGMIIVIAFVAILIVGLMVSRLYKRASKERAFVRTGFTGQLVVINGGALIFPILHETLEVNMQTLKIELTRTGTDALITKDRMRADVGATFFVRVKPDTNAIALAAQTLGTKTMNPDALRQIIEDKFVDALRSVAAGMDMQHLHEQRAEFVQNVQNTVAADLEKNGLELESVSLTKLDQTDQKFLNPNNAFDAEGLTNLAKLTQEKARERNEIEQQARVAIEKRNFEANQESLTIKQQDEFARLDQEKQVETRRAEQEAELAKQRADRKREADVATIEAEQATELARVASSRARQEAEITNTQAIRIAEQAAKIAVNERSEAESLAQAKADEARANAVKAAQNVITEEAIARAERDRQVAVIEATKEAERTSAGITVRAKAEAEAADLQAQARKTLADVLERENEVRAAGERALADAANALSPEQIALRIKLAAIEAAPQLVAELAKPMAAVKSARVVSISGLGANGGATVGGGSAGNVPQDLTNALLNYRTQAPLVDAIVGAAGFDLKNGLAGVVPASTFDFDDAEQVEEEVQSVPTPKAPVESYNPEELQRLAGIKAEKSGK